SGNATRTLFLVDRLELETQADKALKKYLKNDLSCCIFKENKENVSEALGLYIANLQNFQRLLEIEDFDGIFDEMENTNRIKNILNGIK
ncbi:MAG: DEAD/DEAH box helicase family protein, partial [Bacteroidota bacterium]